MPPTEVVYDIQKLEAATDSVPCSSQLPGVDWLYASEVSRRVIVADQRSFCDGVSAVGGVHESPLSIEARADLVQTPPLRTYVGVVLPTRKFRGQRGDVMRETRTSTM